MAEVFKKEIGDISASETIKPSGQDVSTLDVSGLARAIEGIVNDVKEGQAKKAQEAEAAKQEEETTPLITEETKSLPDIGPSTPLTEDPARPSYAKAFLGSISRAEGTDRDRAYNIIVGLGKGVEGAPAFFEDYSKHPNIIGMRGKTESGKSWFSTAAGRFQITKQTWDYLSKKYDLKDFSPANQELGAWLLAKERYAQASRKAGEERDLEKDLQSGTTTYIRSYLGGTWAALKTKFNFEAEYTRRLNELETKPPKYNQEAPKETNIWDY